jgi:hypothetical protein
MKRLAFILVLLVSLPALALYPLLQSAPSQKVYVYLVDSTDHITAETGVTGPTVTISKNGGNLVAPNDGTWYEVTPASGIYTVAIDATDSGTVGPMIVQVVKGGCDTFRALCYVRATSEAQIYADMLPGDTTGSGFTAIPTIAAVTTVANVSGAVDSVTDPVSISGTKQTLDALHDAPALVQRSEPPTAEQIDAQLSGVHGPGAWGGAAGSGDTEVDHNTGGVDTLRYVHEGVAIGGASVRAYVKADYDAGTYTIRGQTTTKSDGRWVSALYLNSGITYYVVFNKPDSYGPDKVEVTP